MDSNQESLFDVTGHHVNDSSEINAGFSLRTANWLLGLMGSPGIGPNKAIRIASKFHNLDELSETDPETLKKLLNGTDLDTRTIREVDASPPDDVQIVTYFDKEYPSGLRDLSNPPPVLWYRGFIPDAPGVAIVGTRKPSTRGAMLSSEAGRISAELNLAVVSGLALGVDSAAHSGSLALGGPNVAVLACDVRNPSPKSNAKVAERILEKGGCLVAEVPPGSVTEARSLVARNRIQAAWAKGLLMAECGIPSGTLHTVRFAFETKRKIAVFGPKLLGSQSSSNAGNYALSDPNGCDPEILGGTKAFMSMVSNRKPCADFVLDSQESTEDFLSSLN